MPEWLGICGSSGRSCMLVWSSKLGPDRIGVYPQELLPSRRTVWHASVDGAYTFSAPLTSVGNSGVGIPSADIFAGAGIFRTDIQYDTFRPQSQFVLCFAKTANRLNVAHILTQDEINSADPTTGIGFIDTGEYVFDAVAAVFSKTAVEQELTQEDLAKIAGSGVSVQDRAFQKLFELTFEGNRFQYVQTNQLGIEYRLDNGGPKASAIFEQAGIGDLKSVTYRDATSRILAVNLLEPANIPSGTDQNGNPVVTARPPRAGDTIYLSYVAVKEHYWRDLMVVSWSMTAISLPPQCYGLMPRVRVARYRFYEWNIEPDKPGDRPVMLAGWRAVEAQGLPVNLSAMVNFSDPQLADYLWARSGGLVQVRYMPAAGPSDGQPNRDITVSELQAYINDRSTLPAYDANLSQQAAGASYHPNVGSKGSPNAYKSSTWYKRRAYTIFGEYDKMIRHVYYNMHARALKKRDVDKFAIERSLAEEIENDYSSGLITLYPFMDDGLVDNPLAGANDYLSASNCKFQPIQPPSSAFFAEMQCGVAGGWVLGGPYGRSFSANGDVLSAFWVESPIVTEKMDIETRVLIERHFTVGGTGVRLVAIEGLGGGIQGLSCLGLPSRSTAIAVHVDSDGWLRFHKFIDGYILQSLNNLEYRPDLGNLPYENNDLPTVEQFEKDVGYSGMLGDHPGISPGWAISGTYAPNDAFVYFTNDEDHLKTKLGFAPDESSPRIFELTYRAEDDIIHIESVSGFVGVTEIEYAYSGVLNLPVQMLLRNGGDLAGVVDSLRFSPSGGTTLQVDHRWISCDKIEIVGSGLKDVTIKRITVVGIDEEVSNDFIFDTSSTEDDKQKAPSDRLEGKPLLFSSDLMSIGTDDNGRIFVFFNDKDGGISCAQSDDFGLSWYYHYGIVESINEDQARHPFVINQIQKNTAYLFYLLSGKVLCRRIQLNMFNFDDALLIQRFYRDVLTRTDDKAEEKIGLFSSDGRSLRYRSISYVAAGNRGDAAFLELTGRNVADKSYEPTEIRDVEVNTSSNNVETKEVETFKNTIVWGPWTAVSEQDVNDPYFSAFRSNNGLLYLMFLGDVDGDEGKQLLCHFSTDDGENWYDLLEYSSHGKSRARSDPYTHTSYIEKDGSKNTTNGINVHWSRLKKHKKEGGTSENDESITVEIETPYAFYEPSSNKVFLFYVYQGCLLCKSFDKAILDGSSESKRDNIKRAIERGTRACFVDGNLSTEEIRSEIHYWVNESTEEQLVSGNIIFHHQDSIDTFDESREVGPQRVSAYALTNGMVRVFYKHRSDNKVRAAIWDGSRWRQEDLYREKSKHPAYSPSKSTKTYTPVTGGFGAESFPKSR